MKTAFNRLEKLILMLSILCILSLIIIQFLSYDDNYGIYASKVNHKAKFIPFTSSQNNEKGIIVLKNLNSNYKDIQVLLNGDPIDDFTKKDEIEVFVYNNDMLEIDGTKYDKKLNIKVVGVSNNIEFPKLDTIVTTSQSIETLGKVHLK